MKVGVFTCFRNPAPGLVHDCLRSLVRQIHEDWRCIAVDDNSDADLSGWNEAMDAAKDSRITVVSRDSRKGGLANYLQCCKELSDCDILLQLDGDDKFYGAGALSSIVEEYENGADFTYGSCQECAMPGQYRVYMAKPFRDLRSAEIYSPRSFSKVLFVSVFSSYPEAFLDLGQADDMALAYPLLAKSQRPVAIGEVLCLVTRGGAAHQSEKRASAWEQIVSSAEKLA